MPFPPTPVYPNAIDSDYTLYLVYDTTETKLSADNQSWSQEVSIMPTAEDKPEIWADNGFANISGELFYYDSVEKDPNTGKIIKLKGCARNLGGEKTKFNKRGTWVRSYVVAEHHNQLVESIVKTQDFVGRNFDERQETLDWRIRNLQELEVIFDDFNCPDINFTWNIIENHPVRGVLAQYLVEITPPGTVNSFRLDFGDGEYTTTQLSGEHRYPLNARIDPVIKVSNDKCQIIQTPIERDNPAEPVSEVNPSFNLNFPEFPEVPDFVFVPYEVPEPDINLPPLVTPCFSLTANLDDIPSIIIGPDINMVSNITITSNHPINIPHSHITITGDFPSIIVIDPPIPPTIVIDPPIPPTIVIVPPQSNIVIDLEIADMPRLEVDWGRPPEMEVGITFVKTANSPVLFNSDKQLHNEFGEEFSDLFYANNKVEISYDTVGIPSEVQVIMPKDMDVKLDASDLNDRKIKIDSSDVKLPDHIKLVSDLPQSIALDASQLNECIDRLYELPAIAIDASEIPTRIELISDVKIPEKIIIESACNIPDKIKIEGEVKLEVPAGIPLILPENLAIPLKFPDEMPEIVVKTTPIDVKIRMEDILEDGEEGKQCFYFVPCKK